ncbi:MAG: hypothetical protein IJS78_03870 [Clostridia bacterium]|nr:hypothetical protein [Clostridia bacterium]
MKKTACAVLALVFAAALAVGALAGMAEDPKAYDVWVGPDGLDYMDFDSDAVCHADLGFGQTITVLGEYGAGEFIVVIPGPEEYERVRITEAELGKTYPLRVDIPETVGARTERTTGTVISDTPLNIRFGPSTYFDVKGAVPVGGEVSYEYSFRNWGYVDYYGVTGWISLDCVGQTAAPATESAEQSSEPPATEPPATEPEMTEPAPTEQAPSEPSQSEGPPATEPVYEPDPETNGGTTPSVIAPSEPSSSDSETGSEPSGGVSRTVKKTSLKDKLHLSLGWIAFGATAAAAVIIAIVVRADKKKRRGEKEPEEDGPGN